MRDQLLAAVYQAVSYYAMDSLGHIVSPSVDMRAGYGGSQDVISLRCAKCGEAWWIDVSYMFEKLDMYDALCEALDRTGKCRGKPLYCRIEGTPWFEYAT